ncbi:phosphopantetheine-binding protein [Amycolatopsis sp. OK19-0408]|uniref:Phosphopantetheine-binding protein n=1 Tax=Amycolatopsis iheyensis TaxID=2945988 RepID=A0A9X2SKK6_9PSEU|nr:phosphopantetheine-binding protein [Amycolatopsis iheyensis]MCR6483505.1 phosphopantetheine-binding protein [Amycolatopsis iheyensis]
MDPRFTELLARFLRFLDGREITPESNLRELGLDSMQSIELLFAIEDVFDVALPDEDLTDATFATAGSLWKAVAAALGKPDERAA